MIDRELEFFFANPDAIDDYTYDIDSSFVRVEFEMRDLLMEI